jgi:spore coat protein H
MILQQKKYIVLLIAVLAITFRSDAQTGTKVKAPKDFGKEFFEKDSIHTIRLTFSQCNYWDSLTVYKKLLDSINVSNYIQASVSIDGKSFYACGIRFKGESSYDFYPGKKKPFRIKFNRFIKNQDFKGLDELNLTNNFKDPTMIREKLYLDIMNRERIPAPRATFAKVYINDKYWGLYMVNENIDDTFLETRFNDKRGNLYQGEPMANFVYLGSDPSKYYNRYVLKTNLKKNDWTDLVRFIRTINDTTVSQEEYVRKLEAVFNLDKCLRAWAINNLIGNIDAYNMFYPHNFYIFHDSVTFKWHWISLDGNYAFAAWNPVKTLPSLVQMSILIPDSVPYKEPRPLLEHTLGKNKIIQKRYIAIVQELLNHEFNPEKLTQAIDSISARIRVSVYADNNKMYSNNDFDTNLGNTLGDPLDPGNFIPGLKSFITERIRSVEMQIAELNRKLN